MEYKLIKYLRLRDPENFSVSSLDYKFSPSEHMFKTSKIVSYMNKRGYAMMKRYDILSYIFNCRPAGEVVQVPDSRMFGASFKSRLGHGYFAPSACCPY